MKNHYLFLAMKTNLDNFASWYLKTNILIVLFIK